ncbi:MAG: glucuronate isomerase [Spirochaetia bacterium]
MASFLTEDFLLHTETARRLYHDHAAHLPIFDYHCHLSPAAIAEDARFANITGIWLAGDHYKWRAMRTNGVSEDLITGSASDREKFQAWADTVPATIGNPLYHWTHLELRNPVGIDDLLLDGGTAEEVWRRTGDMLATPEFSVRGILKEMNVRFICTTDDPLDDLSHHRKIAEDPSFTTRVLPAFRPDKGVHIEQTDQFRAWLSRLQELAGRDLPRFDDFLAAVDERLDYFHEMGARISDHALVVPPFQEASQAALNTIYRRVRDGGRPDQAEAEMFQTAVLQHLGRSYARRGWVMQLHIGALRNNATRMFASLGSDTGFDSINDEPVAGPLNRLLDSLDVTGELPRTILYSLNAGHNDVLATTIGNFQDGSIAGKMQFGSSWWFHDQKDGILRQITSLANMGLLSRFVGMLTDSRSFLSYTRHEYFRRILCGFLGDLAESGEAPRDIEMLGKIVEDVGWRNAVAYCGIPMDEEN